MMGFALGKFAKGVLGYFKKNIIGIVGGIIIAGLAIPLGMSSAELQAAICSGPIVKNDAEIRAPAMQDEAEKK